MLMLGSIVNAAAIAVAALIGSAMRRGIPERVGKTMLTGAALSVIFIGIRGAEEGYAAFCSGGKLFADYGMLAVILSLAIGGLFGELLDIDGLINRLGSFVEGTFTRRARKEAKEPPSLAIGFVNCTILFCVGSMAILGAIEDTGTGTPDILFSKAVLDAIAALVMATTMGVGCALSAIPVLLYQGFFTLLALVFLSGIPAAAMGGLSTVGSLIVMAIGFNMLGVTKIKTANFIPALFLPLLTAFLL